MPLKYKCTIEEELIVLEDDDIKIVNHDRIKKEDKVLDHVYVELNKIKKYEEKILELLNEKEIPDLFTVTHSKYSPSFSCLNNRILFILDINKIVDNPKYLRNTKKEKNIVNIVYKTFKCFTILTNEEITNSYLGSKQYIGNPTEIDKTIKASYKLNEDTYLVIFNVIANTVYYFSDGTKQVKLKLDEYSVNHLNDDPNCIS